MSTRLETTPWLTKNLAAGWFDTRASPQGADGGRSDGWYRTANPATTRFRGRAAYDRRHAPGPRHRQQQRHARPVPGGCAARHASRGHGPARDRRRAGAAAERPPAARRPRAGRHRRDRAGVRGARPDRGRRNGRRSDAATALLVASAGSVPIAVRVDRPDEVGADRLVNALAAARLYGTPAVVVDFGTATTLDCVATDGAYVGGAIAPGLELGLEALAARTAKLPRIELRTPDRAIGRNTVQAMQSGTIFGYQALAAGLLERVRAELAEATGVEPSGDQGDPDRRAVGGAVGPGAARRRRHRSGADAQGPRHPARRGRRRRAARAGAGVTGRLAGRLIGLGVTGSIAAYKAVELLRLLQAEGADVAVMLSPSATRFVGPLSFAALSRHPVETDLLELTEDGRIGHIVVGDSADAIVVAPATAHFLAAMAAGLSGDVVTATCLATRAPVVVAPAMDGDMWTHPATTANVAPAARRLRLHDRRPGGRVRSRPGSPASAASRTCRGSWRRSSPRSAIARSGRRIPRRARRSSPRPATPTWRTGTSSSPLGGTREADRSRPVHRQSLHRPDGCRDRRGGAGPRRPGHRSSRRPSRSRSPRARTSSGSSRPPTSGRRSCGPSTRPTERPASTPW